MPHTKRDRSVDVCVRKLRAKLDCRSATHTYIHTHPGVGYRFAAEPKDPAPGSDRRRQRPPEIRSRLVSSEPQAPAVAEPDSSDAALVDALLEELGASRVGLLAEFVRAYVRRVPPLLVGELGHGRAGRPRRRPVRVHERARARRAGGARLQPRPRGGRLARGRVGRRGQRRGLAVPRRHRHHRDARARPAGARRGAPGDGRRALEGRPDRGDHARPGRPPARVGDVLPGRPPPRRRRARGAARRAS